MAIKKAPIISAQQVYLTCDKCGALMKYTGMSFYCNPPVYQHACECGYTENHSQMFPYQLMTFDRGREEEVISDVSDNR